MLDLKVNIDRLSSALDVLAACNDAALPAVTRVLYTEKDVASRAIIRLVCSDAGLAVREDSIGNLFARWCGSEPDLPAVGTGSHIDAIPFSGRFDGTVGVLGGVEAIRTLQSAGFQPRRSIELLMFTSEEPTRFGVGCVGSRAMSGALDPAALARLVDGDGGRFDDIRQAAGFSGPLDAVRLPADYYSSFVELHIEQGPILERERVSIGAVTAIAAPAALRVKITGSGGHAGAVLMPDRHDALCAAAEIVLAVENEARHSGSPDTVGTVGACQVHPGASNSVPSGVTLTIDIRDIALAPRDQTVGAVVAAIYNTQRRGVKVEIETLNADAPAAMAARIIDAIEAAGRELNVSCRRMVSRAYHDSLFMARLCETGMIFIPCRNGYSHRPDEFASPEAIAEGVAVLAGTLAKLAS